MGLAYDKGTAFSVRERMLFMGNDFKMIFAQAQEIIQAEPWYISALSNISALLMESMTELNWAGFYLNRNGRLTVGPFQGKPACIHISFGKGVCGKAAESDKTIVVPDVHDYPGHIACDAASMSEIVIPIHFQKNVVGVLDLDSPVLNRFSEEDTAELESLVQMIEAETEWPIL